MQRTDGVSVMRRRGPKPLLSVEHETQLVQWVLAQQSAGQRMSRDDVIAQAQEILRQDETPPQHEQDTKPTQKLGMGWCNRFIARYPELSLRSGGSQQAVPATNEESIAKNAISESIVPGAAHEEGKFKTLEAAKQPDTIRDADGPTKTRKYNRKHMEAAVEMYLAGRPMSEVTQRFPLLHQRTIRRRVLRVQRGEVDKRRGPRPLLEGEPEQELVNWILDMQSRGTKVTKKDILARANEHYRALTGKTGEKLKDGWLRRFKERHPVLSGRAPAAQQEDSGTEDEKFSSNGDNESPSSSPSKEVIEKKRESQHKREILREAEDSASPKRLKTEEVVSSDTTRRGSILPERRQSDKEESIAKLDAIMESNKRLEAMQRQQLEMLQQLSTLPTSCSRVCGEYEQCFVYNNAEYCAPLCAPGRCNDNETCILRGVVPCTSDPCIPQAVCEPKQSVINMTTSTACKLNCQLISSPVCGSDNVSYANSCFLKEARCSTGNSDLHVVSRGLCESEKALNAQYNPPVPRPSTSDCLDTSTCADVLDPVCTSAGTMQNLCYFRRQQRCNQNTMLIRSGSCEDTNVMPLCPATCTQTYSPVCASNGQLYGNECLFRQAKCARRDLLAVNIEPRVLSECNE
ncbi:hypothetical protein PPTG_22277 [Phytophthora nicotianae INRA-310]|uniref:HTH CENPB-type domain-containing protein n=4 Tax=Phytophthora nicotianae TaxID=4792 RepID=W2QLY8_PHYN3|nr:hypothetical protein PPTG_22277 [Phytophthora nicotianae INRA-310]ETN13931.1 hypothetical protein PPTG_22277 [Phytophthora nicotianae INRA-310]